MPNNSLPTLSRPLLDDRRKGRSGNLELPPESLLGAPETILQLGFGKFLRGYTPDFVQLANLDGRYSGRIISVQRQADHRSEAAASRVEPAWEKSGRLDKAPSPGPHMHNARGS